MRSLRATSLILTVTGTLVFGAPLAHAQSFNIAFGPSRTTRPADTYAAAGLPGVWNSTDGQSNVTLVDLDGRSTSVVFHQSGASSLLTASDPSVTGQDAALLNHALITNNAGVEVCMMIDGLATGRYEVTVYAWMPSAPGVKSRSREDLATATQDVGGAWTGSHVEGVTYARYVLDVTGSGFLGSHSGIVPGAPAANGAATNGMQIRKLGSGADGGAGVDAGTRSMDGGASNDAGGARTDGGGPDALGRPNPHGQDAGAGGGSAVSGCSIIAAHARPSPAPFALLALAAWFGRRAQSRRHARRLKAPW